ncbi:hypothetical protein MEY_02730, partial [Candida albicans 19F]
ESTSGSSSATTPGSSSATTPGTSSVESTPGTSTGSCWISVSTGGYGYETTVTICSDVTSGQSVTTPTTISVPSTFCTTVPTAGTDETVITSYVTSTAHSTEVITVTSCADNGCQTHTTHTGVVVVTVTTTDVATTYTTYCPLTTTKAVYRVAKLANYKRDQTEFIATETNENTSNWPAPTLVPYVGISNDSSAAVSTFEGAANSVVPRLGLIAGFLSALLFLF